MECIKGKIIHNLCKLVILCKFIDGGIVILKALKTTNKMLNG